MHNHKKIAPLIRFLSTLVSILCGVFWLLALFGFDDTRSALLTLVAALLHELGHEAALLLLGHPPRLPLPRLHGFRIKKDTNLSYKEDIIVLASGPLANAAAGLAGLLLADGGFFSFINFLTALSNLLPIRSYDGYKILCAISDSRNFAPGRHILDICSLLFAAAALFVSLYAIDRLDAGYWIFGVFFIFLLKEIKISLSD